MSSHTTLVNVDVDTASKLALYVSQLIGGPEGSEYFNACKSLAADAKTESLIAKFLEKQDVIFAVENERDIEGFFEAVASVAFTLREDVDTVPVVRDIAAVLTADKSAKTKLRLRALVSLFNLTFIGQSKYNVLTEIFKYALATGQTGSVSQYYERIEGWATSWGLSTLQQRELYQATSDILAKEGKNSLALRFLILYLGTYGVDAYPPEVEQLATTTVLKAVKSPVSSYSDRNALLESFANRKATGELGTLVELLKIICTGTLAAYVSFAAANRAFLTAQGVVPEEAEHAMRLLTLCTLGTQQPVLTFKAIAAALQIDVEEVEIWVVEAISEGLLDASIDQLNSVITVTRTVHRSFGPEQWKSLQQRLRTLRATVANVLETAKKYSA